MFSKSNRIKELEEQLAKAEQVILNSQKHNEAMQTAYRKSCALVDVTASGRELIFKFRRNEEFFDISTYALMGDNVEVIKEKAGLK